MGIAEEYMEASDGIAPECHPCVLKHALSAARFAGLGEEQVCRVVEEARAELEQSGTSGILVQHVVRQVADAIIREKGASPFFDIYADLKERSNHLSLAYADSFQKDIDASASPLETGLQMAAAGNIIDFGAKDHAALDLHMELQSLGEVPFTRYDFAAFRQALDGAATLLYLCDNSGEIVFDMLFITQLQRAFPALRIVAALRDQPIINDATLADAEAVGLDRLVPVMSSGSVYPGTILDETTAEFREFYAAADVILSKGQGNFETLLPLADERVFFLLRIKCQYMAALSGVEKDSLVLMQAGSINAEGV